MIPKRSPRAPGRRPATRQTTRRARMPTICRATTVCRAAIDPDLAALVDRGGFVTVGRQELSGRVADPRDRARRRHAVDVHVHRRQKNADLLPRRRAARRPAPAAPATARGRRPATARRRRLVRRRRDRDRGRRTRRTRRARRTAAPATSRRTAPRRARAASAPPMNGSPARSTRITGDQSGGRGAQRGTPARERPPISARASCS